ncbi:reverse transcriptase/retron type [Marinobacter lipolyticus SM19]|uniref:Reverse transcriptase/retron type n=2 Tax=Marinobacter lipolyticus TaxID=209639 RepID=R8AW19_9GAMM|nr:reverse transcriptase/retron type [Marinobacter lipolyticus SM19]
MYPVLRHFNRTLVAWAMKKFKCLKGRKMRASQLLKTLAPNQTKGREFFYSLVSNCTTPPRLAI